MPVNNLPDSTESKLIDILRRLKDLESAPLLNAAATKGNITVNPPGQIQFNPTGTGVVISAASSPFSGPQAEISFPSQFPGIVAPFIAMQDSATLPILQLQSSIINGQYSGIGLFSNEAQLSTTDSVAGGHGLTQVIVNVGSVQMTFGSAPAMTFFTDGTNGYVDWGTGMGRIISNNVPEFRCVQNAGLASYIPIRASAFTVSSLRATKERIHDLPWSALDVIDAAPVHRWRYKEEHAGDRNYHISPMADDLPEELVIRGNDDEYDVAVDQRDLVGVLWAAVQELRAEVADLKARLGKE